jgi:hypothetical protein
MPNHIPGFQIANFLATNTIPLRLLELSALADTATDCSICHNPFADPPQDFVHPDLPRDEDEYAVQVHNRGECKHIFGRHCLEHHIRGGNPWSHTCPLCRTEWFPAPNARRQQMLVEVERTLNTLAALELDDEQARTELGHVEVALGRIREALYGSRWI